jgi:plastocyanin
MKNKVLFLVISATVAFLGTYLSMKIIDEESTGLNNDRQKNIHMVSLLQDGAEPDIIIAKPGDYVQFNARDGTEHNLSQGSGNASSNDHLHDGAGIGSGVFQSDEAYKVQFKKQGIYSFHDHLNPDIYVRVVVKNQSIY